jgi:hypothetical protein
MNRQQRRFQERQDEKMKRKGITEEERIRKLLKKRNYFRGGHKMSGKPITQMVALKDLVDMSTGVEDEDNTSLDSMNFNKHKGWIPSRNGFFLSKNTPRVDEDFLEIHNHRIGEVNIKDIKRVIVKRFDNGYTDDFVCMMMGENESEPTGVEEVIDLDCFHKEGKIKGLSDLWRISNTGFCHTRGKGTYVPFVVFDQEGEEKEYSMDSQFLLVWNDDGDCVRYDQDFIDLMGKHYKKQNDFMDGLIEEYGIDDVNEALRYMQSIN